MSYNFFFVKVVSVVGLTEEEVVAIKARPEALVKGLAAPTSTNSSSGCVYLENSGLIAVC